MRQLCVFVTLLVFCIVHCRGGCGCEGIVDTCGIIDGGAGIPPVNDTTIYGVLCSDCVDALPDHCGVCGGCQQPFVTSVVATSHSSGGLVTGNRLGSIASLATDHVACGQYHSPDITLPVKAPSGVWSFAQNPPPSPAYDWMEYKLTEVSGNAFGHSSDASDNLLLIGNRMINPKKAHFFGRTVPSPPFKWFFDLDDPCGGNQYGWDVAVDEQSGFLFVSDPKAYFNGTVWVYRVISPTLVQNITYSGGFKGERFGHSIDAQSGQLAVGRPNCKEGVPNGGCVNFYHWNGTKWLLNYVVVNSPDPFEGEKIGWRVSTDGNWTVVGAASGGKAQVYRRSGLVWNYHQTLEEPGVYDENNFGYAIQIRNGTIAVGDERYPVSPTARGRVFLYRLQGGMWQLWSTYNDTLDSFNTHFGSYVDLSDDYLLVGVPGAQPRGMCLIIERNVSQCFGCDGVYNSCKKLDLCGICDGDNSTCPGCDGVPGSGKVFDGCGVCGGYNDTCIILYPVGYPVPCNNGQGKKLNSTSFVIGTLFNTTLYTNFTLNNIPAVGSYSFNTSSGNFTFTPPFMFEGPVVINVTACYVEKAAVVPPECASTLFGKMLSPCKNYVPPEGVVVCNTTVLSIIVLSCEDCNGVNGTGNIVDACGVCGGDNSTCSGCDGVPDSGKVLDFCGVCGGKNTTCLDVFLPPFPPGPCNPYKFQLWWEPHANNVFWTVMQQPTYGTMSLNPYLAIISYFPPSSMSGVGPSDTIVVIGKDGHGNSDTVTISIPMSLFVPDVCGLCAGNGSSCLGCDGVPNSGLVPDRCGVCGGDGSTCGPLVSDCSILCWMVVIAMFLFVTTGSFGAYWLYKYIVYLYGRSGEPPISTLEPTSPIVSVNGYRFRVGNERETLLPYTQDTPYGLPLRRNAWSKMDPTWTTQ